MFEHTTAEFVASMLVRNQEAQYAAQAPQAIARREFALLRAAGRDARRPRVGFRQALARLGARLFRGAGTPVPTGR